MVGKVSDTGKMCSLGKPLDDRGLLRSLRPVVTAAVL